MHNIFFSSSPFCEHSQSASVNKSDSSFSTKKREFQIVKVKVHQINWKFNVNAFLVIKIKWKNWPISICVCVFFIHSVSVALIFNLLVRLIGATVLVIRYFTSKSIYIYTHFLLYHLRLHGSVCVSASNRECQCSVVALLFAL